VEKCSFPTRPSLFRNFNMSLCSFNADMNQVKESTQTRFVRSVAGFTLLDEKRNGKVRKLCKVCLFYEGTLSVPMLGVPQVPT
jgi:hypothetical protein